MNGCIPKLPMKLSARIFLLLALAANDLAQQPGVTIKGKVTDQLGSLVINAIVVARVASGADKTTTTNSTGTYEFRSFPPGRYDLNVTAQGFNVLEGNN